MPRREFRLVRGGLVLAILRPDGRQLLTDYQAVEGTFETTAAFEPIRTLFEREVELLDVDSNAENNEWLDIWEQLREPGLFVESMSERVEILWIHFQNGRAWWFPLYNSPLSQLKK